jgi:predicted metalloprotease with PDZ domain
VGVAPPHVARRLRSAVGLAERPGALVRGVSDGSPAQRGGIARGDLIVAIGDDQIDDPAGLEAALARCQPGDTVVVGCGGADELAPPSSAHTSDAPTDAPSDADRSAQRPGADDST